MFSRRRTQPVNQAPNTSAASAAAQAFLSHRSSNASLSSAAAAAALRSHTTSPISVADTQTRRTLRRQASNSSLGSNGSRPGLQRTGSSGSMTERTFRSPSPGNNGKPRVSTDAPPPVPPIPKKVRQRASSVEHLPRVASPPPTKPGGRGVSLDRGTPQQIPPSRAAARKASGLSNIQEMERADSRNSVNFSRPIPASPVQEKSTPSPLETLGAAEVRRIQKQISGATDEPLKVKKKKKKAVAAAAPPVRDEPAPTKGPNQGALTAATGAASSVAGPPASAPKKKKKKKVVSASDDQSSDSVRDRPDSPSTKRTAPLKKRPSTVREAPEEDEEESEYLKRVDVDRQNALRQLESASVPSKPEPKTAVSSLLEADKLDSASGSRKGSRPTSLSPSRQAHFATTPALTSPDIPKHQPPPRALSPAKSALKHSPSRDGSPAGYYAHGKTPSEVSDSNTMLSEDGAYTAKQRRKNVRVSFEEGPVLLGQAASPPTTPDSPVVLSPQHKENGKKQWFGRSKKKNEASATDDEEDLEGMMRPRPALPSFGSVRSRKDGEEFPAPAQASSDHAIGSVIAAGAAKNSPAPPVVTSVEGSGYDSGDNETDLSSEGSALHKIVTADEGDQSNGKTTAHNGHVKDIPQIAFTQPTPTLEQKEEFLTPTSEIEPPILPLDPTPATVGIAEPEPPEVAAAHEPSTPTIGHVAEDLKAQLAATHESTSEEETDSDEEEEEEDSSEVYSDAAEDLADPEEGDGFGSINAIVESPDSAPGLAITTPPESPSIGASQTTKTKKNRRSKEDPQQPPADQGWDKAQEYWAGLSEDRKREMEEAAAARSKKSVVEDGTAKLKPKKKTASATKSVENPTTVAATRAAAGPRRQAQQQDDKPMRKTLRANPAPEVVAAKKRTAKKKTTTSSTATSGPILRKSMRSSTMDEQDEDEDSTPPRTSFRPLSAPVNMPLSANTTRHLRAMSSGTRLSASPSPAPAPAPPSQPQPKKKKKGGLGRTLSGGSDSDSASSFKKSRAKSPAASTSSGFGRKTMRGPAPASASVPPANRRPQSPDSITSTSRRPFSLRSLSPTGSNAGTAATRRPFSSAGSSSFAQGTMRTSMRGTGSSSAGPSLRNSMVERPSSPSSSLFSSLRPKKKEKAPKKASLGFGGGAKKKGGSRFADDSSSDSDIDAPSRRQPQSYKSRFADSSDEEEFTPVRGIPRRSTRESTDLEDESADEAAATKAAEKHKGNEGKALSSGTLRPSSPPPAPAPSSATASPRTEEKKKKRSLFSSLGRRKDKDKVIGKTPTESAVRTDTKLERSALELAALRTQKETEIGAEAPSSPIAASSPVVPSTPTSPARLVKRPSNGPRAGSASWPLPPPIPADTSTSPVTERPSTADGSKSKRTSFFGGSGEGRPGLLGYRRATDGDARPRKEEDVPPVPALPSSPAGGASLEVRGEGVAHEGGKKKRFPLLRKVLRLND